jgi:hypothetical protein
MDSSPIRSTPGAHSGSPVNMASRGKVLFDWAPAQAAPDDLRGAMLEALRNCFAEDPDQPSFFDACADLLLARASGPELNLSDMRDAGSAQFVRDLPPQVWQVMQQQSLASGQQGITSVKLSPELSSGGASLVAGMRELETLESLMISEPPDRDTIDFGDLHGTQLERVQLTGAVHPHAALQVFVPTGVSAEATEVTNAVLRKVLVHSVDIDGNVAPESRTLQGIIQDHRARDFDADDLSVPHEAEYRARGVRLNGEATMDVQRSGQEVQDPIVCRHLTLRWLQDRREHRASKQAHAEAAQAQQQAAADLAPHPHFSYRQYATPPAIRAHTGPAKEDDYDRMMTRKAVAVFEPRGFGAMLADFAAKLRPGEVRHFGINTGPHMLGVELRTRLQSDGSTEWVVNLYDPNQTATHQRVLENDPAALRNLDLASWIGAANVEKYFEPGTAQVANFYAWPPEEAEAELEAAPPQYVAQATVGTAAFLNSAMDGQQPELVRESVQALLAKADDLGADELESELRAVGYKGRPALQAVVTGRRPHQAETLDAYASEILAAPLDVLDAAAKARLLRAEFQGDIVLHRALVGGNTVAVKALVSAVLDAPESAVGRELRWEMLFLSASPEGRLLRNYLRSGAGTPLSTPEKDRCDALRAYVSAIVGAPSLTLLQKQLLLFNANCLADGTPTAQVALRNGNPVAAAAFVVGVLESTAEPALKAIILRGMNVELPRLDMALRRLPVEADRAWAEPMTRAVHAHAAAAAA